MKSGGEIMQGLVLYDSAYGNTKEVANTIAQSLGIPLVHVSDIEDLPSAQLDLLIVGSPTQGGRPTQTLQKFLDGLLPDTLYGINVAAFDTRFDSARHGPFLAVVMRLVQYAAPRIAKSLQDAGGHLIASPQGFIVEDTKGPLSSHTLDEATEWAQTIYDAARTAKVKR